MKKLLLTTAAIGLAMAATPAHAEIDLELGGYAKVYAAFTDHDEVAGGTQANDADFVRDTELHFTGQTTLDNGLTVGAHIEAEVDNEGASASDDFDVDESYVFASGNWGRVNVGAEDGAAYLLQVSAPSADSNVDGIRQYVNAVNTLVLANNGTGLVNSDGGFGIDYDQDITGKSDKITYLTPVFSGFQLGASFTPDSNGSAEDLEGVGTDDVEDTFGAGYELAARYEGQVDAVGFTIGAGFSQTELEANTTHTVGEATDDRTAWNIGADLEIGPFGVGISYMEDDLGEEALTVASGAATSFVDDEETLVIGADYTTGNFKIGASYADVENFGNNDEMDATRWAAGVAYTYGPGMTFNGSIGAVEYEDDANIGAAATQEVEATYVLLGTQVNF